MKKTTIVAVLTTIFPFLVFVSCQQATDDGGSNASGVVSGTITVTAVEDWTNLKIGVFSGGVSGTYPDLKTDDGGTTGTADYRVIYDLVDDGSPIAVQQVAGTTASISGTGATSRNYTFELPSAVPGEDVTYYYAAWIDANSDGILDLKDSYLDSVAKTGEFNRCANKATVDNDDVPTVLAITGFLQSRDLNGNLSGNYKYSGYDTTAYLEALELDTAERSSGFNFHMIPNLGW